MGSITFVNLLFLTQSAMLEVASQNFLPPDQHSPLISNEFPSCVEVVEVWPPPHSVLEPFAETHSALVHYALRITFSKPVGIETVDTTGGYQLDLVTIPFGDIAPVFFSPSPTNLTRYYPHRLKNWHGSDRTFMAYFVTSAKEARLELTDKVYLVIDGGRFYSLESVGPEKHQSYVQTTILGEYYFGDYLRKHPQYETKPPQPIVPSIYCQQQSKRPYFTTSDTQGSVESDGASLERLTVELPTEGHRIHIASPTVMTDHGIFAESAKTMLLLLSVTTRGWGGKAAITLPPTIKANYKGVNVTVKLHQHSITFKQPTSVPRLTVPVKRSLVYGLRERIYHNKEKVMSRVDAPIFARLSLSSEPSDRKLFPQTVVQSNQIVSLEVIDPVLNVKLRQYYSRSRYAGNAVLPLPNLYWNEVTRSAPISAKKDHVRYTTVPEAFKKMNDMSKLKFLQQNSRACPPDSKRNPGHQGALIDHVIEFGSMYHMLEPLDYSSWSVEEVATETLLVTKNGERKPLTITSREEFYANSFPPLIRKALENYVCLIPPIKDVSRPTRGQNEIWLHLDECIFVPMETARSRGCGGLMLFKNVQDVVSDPDFCSKNFGDCVGLPFSSPKRFPVIPTYGLHELTGWIASSEMLLDFQAHPVGSLLVKKPKYARSRALLKVAKAHDTPESSSDRISLQLLPVFGPMSLMEYIVELTEGFEILNPDIAAPGDNFCESVWQLQIEPPLSISTMHRNAMLMATILNSGKGGGDFVFDVKCSSQIIVSPTDGMISTWIDSGSKTSVKFLLKGNLASGISRALHKCELSVKIQTRPGLHGGIKQAPICNKFIETFYGAFMDVCRYDDDLPLIDLMYYVMPMSEFDSLLFSESLNSSIGSSNLRLVRIITLSLEIPRGEETIAQALSELSVKCDDANVFVLAEEQLPSEGISFIENPNHVIEKKRIVYRSDFTKNRKIIFLANSEWDETEEPSDCSVTLQVSRPNWLCTREVEVLKKLYVPLSELDIKVIERSKAGPFAFLIPLYGPQSNGVMISLLVCLVTTLILSVTAAATHGILYIYRNELPKKGTLQALKADLERAKKEEVEYWENPQVYLELGNDEVEAHFVLHNFKATEPLNTPHLKNLKIAGTLKYMHKELQVMFGHIKKVYVDSSGESGDVWLQASSGMYLLPFANVAPDYKDELVNFLMANGIKPEKLLLPHSMDDSCEEHMRRSIEFKSGNAENELEENGDK